MPTIEQSRSSNIDMSGYEPINTPPLQSVYIQPQSIQRNAYLRCPFPAVGSTATPDTLRQFYMNNSIPQRRTFI